MLKDSPTTGTNVAGPITATAFCDDGRAELVKITDLSFGGCRISPGSSVSVAERLRLHLQGQGCIEAEVRSTSAGTATLVFLTRSSC